MNVMHKNYIMRHLATIYGKEIKFSKVGHCDLDDDHTDLICCMHIGIYPSDLHT